MHCGDVALKFSVCPKWCLVRAILNRAYQGVDVDVVEMFIEKLEGFMTGFRSTAIPRTLLARFPDAANGNSVGFDMAFVFFNAVEWTFDGALWPVAVKLSRCESLSSCR